MSMPRRTFLAGTATLPALAAVPVPQARALDPVMTLGVQYYRPPFPEAAVWKDDLARMRDAGLNTVQLWVMWPWVESKPGRFDFGDYDRLVELADAAGLGLIVSAIAEVHPPWIFRLVPGSEMIDHTGAHVVSSNRAESNYGLTPGGCFDHPRVWERMAGFLSAVVTRYQSAPRLRAWDIWNETRWNVQADGLVCFCPHTLRAFRAWLARTYGSLDGLNRAWKRRYDRWDEVLPGKLPKRPYTEMMAWIRFLTTRANEHARARYALVKRLDGAHPATLHGPSPCPHHQGNIAHPAYPLERGNDWAFADAVDGVGSSVFPTWWKVDDAGLGVIATHVRSAARGKRAWFSEVQGGRAAQGTEPQDPVPPAQQQRWVWNAFASGIDTLLFWCWRDEVFGGEASGYGLVGHDGFGPARLAALRQTADVFERHRALLSSYQPARARVGVFFSPRTYALTWAQTGAGYPPRRALEAYARVLTKQSVPWVTVEEDHLDALDELTLLILPRTLVIDAPVEARLAAFVARGGTLITESECGAWSGDGFWRPPEDRFLARLYGLREVGRRTLATDTITVTPPTGRALTLPAVQWLTPFATGAGRAWGHHADGDLMVEASAGAGRVIAIGAYCADAYHDRYHADFEAFVAALLTGAGLSPAAEVHGLAATRDNFTFVRAGASGSRPLWFVFAPTGQAGLTVRLPAGALPRGATTLHELLGGATMTAKASASGWEVPLPALPWGLAILTPA